MEISSLDYAIIFGFFTLVLVIGLIASKTSGKNTSEFFLSGRNMPWWLLGFSMVATTFSTDTPNLVTDIVRTNGVSGNWVWWAFLLTGLLTVFVYARLWRKSNVTTDIEFYELRYSGKSARFLRWFRAVYLGLAFNVLAMAGVTLAAIKIGQVMLGVSPMTIVAIAGTTTVLFSTFGGFKGVIYTDFLLFIVAMIGAFGAAIYLINLPEVGGLEQLLSHAEVKGKLDLIPSFDDKDAFIAILIIPLAVQWWSAWYPGAEPGGGGYVAQRMLAAKDETHAIKATFFFNIMHYALRPWPWILVALASLVLYPDIASIQQAFPQVDASKLGNDLAYSAMLTKLPAGLLGIVLASLGAAYMSTLSSHLNWGSSYIVNDFYKQQINPNASEKQLVLVGRISTVLLMVLSSFFALQMQNAKQLFDIILMFGAGSGLIFILRWFWWRINTWSEITAMVVSGVVSILISFTAIGPALFGADGFFDSWFQFPFVVIVTTIAWLAVTFLTPAEDHEVLQEFVTKINPGGPGWKRFNAPSTESWNVPKGIMAMLSGCVMVYAVLFSVGNFIYGKNVQGLILFVVALLSGYVLSRAWKQMQGLF